MKLVNGVFVHSAWETAISHFTSQHNRSGLTTQHRIAELYANQVHVTLAVLDDDTLEWDYKLKRLLNPKDFKIANGLLDMLIAQLGLYSETLQAALRLRGAWCELEHVQRNLLLGSKKPINMFKVQCARARVISNVTLLLSSIHAQAEDNA